MYLTVVSPLFPFRIPATLIVFNNVTQFLKRQKGKEVGAIRAMKCGNICGVLVLAAAVRIDDACVAWNWTTDKFLLFVTRTKIGKPNSIFCCEFKYVGSYFFYQAKFLSDARLKFE